MRLSQRQQAAVAVAITILASLVILCTVFGLAWVFALFLRRFSHVFLPLAVAGVAAFVFHPYYRWLSTRLKFPKALALIGVFLSILLPLVAFGWFFGALATEQISDLITRFPEWSANVVAQVKQRWPQVLEFIEQNPWAQRIRTLMEEQQGALVQGLQIFGDKALSAGAVVFRGIGTLVAWAVFPVYFAFFLMAEPKRSRDWGELLPFLKPETRQDVIYLVTEFVNIVVAFFRGQLIIAFLQGLLYAIGFSLVGLRYGFILGLLLGLLNIIPYLGSMIGLGIGLPLAYFQHEGGIEPRRRRSGGLHRRPARRKLPAHAQDHGRPHRFAPARDHRGDLLLGLRAPGHPGHDPGHPADRLPRGFLAPGQGKVHQRAALIPALC